MLQCCKFDQISTLLLQSSEFDRILTLLLQCGRIVMFCLKFYLRGDRGQSTATALRGVTDNKVQPEKVTEKKLEGLFGSVQE